MDMGISPVRSGGGISRGAAIEIDPEWLVALEQAVVHEADGVTARELAERLGCAKSTVRERLAAAVAAGRVEYCGKRRSETIDKRVVWLPVYRLRKKE